jgi:anti-sigma regulatory factor (Ser/Thr protein kinase)
MDGAQQWVLTGVEPNPDDVATVRRQARLVLQSWALDEFSWAVVLLLSELTSNVVRHARTPYDVTMTWDRHTVRLSVRDANTAPPRPHVHVTQAQADGRGLLLVANLATRWGWEPHADGKVVWFELAPPPHRPDSMHLGLQLLRATGERSRHWGADSVEDTVGP